MPSKKPLPKPVSTGFWLVKSEPESYSIDQFAKDKKTLWTGVRNYQARNFMMETMKPGEKVLFYHSNAEPSAIVGLGEVVRTNVPDPTALDARSDYHDPKASKDHPIWFCAEIKFLEKFDLPLSLEEIRRVDSLADMSLLAKGQRLSILQVQPDEFDVIMELV